RRLTGRPDDRLVEIGWGNCASKSLRPCQASPDTWTGTQAWRTTRRRGPSPQAPIQLGLIASTSLSADEIARLAAELAGRLSQRYPSVRWDVLPVRDRLVTPPVRLTELVDAARARLLEEDWDLAVLVTDLPLRLGHRPLLTHSSPTHGVALVSLPALGSRRVNE